MVQPINVQFPTDTIFWSISTQLNTSEEAVDIPSGFVLFPLSFSDYNCLNNCLAICQLVNASASVVGQLLLCVHPWYLVAVFNTLNALSIHIPMFLMPKAQILMVPDSRSGFLKRFRFSKGCRISMYPFGQVFCDIGKTKIQWAYKEIQARHQAQPHIWDVRVSTNTALAAI